MENGYPIMLFDGVCKFCNGSVQWMLQHDRRGVVHFAPLQSKFAREALEKNPSLKNIDSVIVLEPDGQAYIKSDAVLHLASHLGGIYRTLGIGRIIPRFLRDRLYDLVA